VNNLNKEESYKNFGKSCASLRDSAVDILIQRRNPNDPERELLEGVRGEVRRIDAIVQSMLTRAQPGIFNFQPASMNAAVHRAVTLAGHQAKAATTRGQQIQVEFIADPSPIVMKIDAAQIEDAVHGLLTNAIVILVETGERQWRML
jgi:signal transduction histidine kinase